MEVRDRPRLHARDHLPGGADPLNLEIPAGPIGGQTSVDLVYRIPGSLLWLYRLGEAFDPSLGDNQANACLDTSSYDGTPRNLTYRENNGVVGWSTANRPTAHSVEHSAFGDGDDGCVRFNYNGQFPGVNVDEAGTWLQSSISGLSVFGSGLKSVTGWINADPTTTTGAGAPIGLAFGTYTGTGGGSQFGWGVMYDFVDLSLRVFIATANPATVAGVARGSWYHVAVTYDSGGDLFSLYLNAVLITTWAGAGNLGSGTTLRIGGGVTIASTSGLGDFFKGAVDDVAGFSTTLTRDEIAAIYLGKGAGTTTTFTTVTTTAGDPVTRPGAVSSKLTDGSNATQGKGMTSEGDGTTGWEWPTHGVYVSGT